MKLLWQLSNRADPEAREVADRHYNRQKPGTPQFVPPGRCMVLKRKGCFWVTAFPFARYVKHQWAGAWTCTAFRRECGPLASLLIKEAVALTVQFHLWKPSWQKDALPYLGMITFVDEDKVREKPDYGRCYLEAGFKPVGRTKQDDLLALQLPLSSALALWADYGFPRRQWPQ